MIISFGKKIPTATCKIKNTKTREYVPAVLYEYDCRHLQDYYEIKSLPKTWAFKDVISDGIKNKKDSKERYGIETESSFFVLKDIDDNIVGISHLFENKDELTQTNSLAVKFIETNPDKTYKYAGQSMLASHALIARNDGYDKLEIKFPTDNALPFYEKKCGFKKSSNKLDAYTLEMPIKEIKKFLIKVFFRTHCIIKDIREN